MAHCWSVTVDLDGRERKICTTHVPGNEALSRDIDAGRPRRPTDEEIARAVEWWRRTHGQIHQQRGMSPVAGEAP